jgi:SulP family sulfate permease
MAALMGLPPVLGLVTSVVSAPFTAALGRNPVLIGGTASATVPFIGLAVRQQGTGGAAKVCIVASIFMMCFCMLRLGRYVLKVPQAVVTGFSCGVGAMMILSQLSVLTGVRGVVDRTSNNLLYQSWQVLTRIPDAHSGSLLISALVMGVALAAARFAPRAPAPFYGVVVAIIAAFVFGIREKEVGRVAFEIPELAAFSWTPRDVWTVVPSALGLAFVSSVNILITSRVVEHFRGRHKHLRPSDADAELRAYGIANIVAGAFAAPISVGIPARSLANVRSGGTTRLSNIFHSLFIVAFIGVAGKYVSHIPQAALAGVTAYTGICLLEWSTWRRLTHMRRVDAAAFLVSSSSVLETNAVAAIGLGCSLYLLRYAYRRIVSPIQQPEPVRP